MADGTLTSIHIHPVKSCRRIELETVAVSALGVADDRMWQVVDDDGYPLHQRQHPIMATVQPKLSDGGGLQLSAPNGGSVDVPAPGQADGTVKSLFRVSVDVADAGDEVADWFSRLLGQPARLAAIPDGGGWEVPPQFELGPQRMAFGDAAPVLVTTTSSLDWLVSKAKEPFGMDRFRPNLVVENDDPWVEDTWVAFEIGAASLALGMPWPRCAMPQIDQDSGERHKEPAVALKAHRWCAAAPTAAEAARPILEGNALFGIGCNIRPEGAQLSVGDTVTVQTTADPLIPAPV